MSEPLSRVVTAAGLGWDGCWNAYRQVAALDTPSTNLAPGRVVAVHRGTVAAQPVTTAPEGPSDLPKPVLVALSPRQR